MNNEAPRPEAEVSGRPPRGGRLREVAPVGGEGSRRPGSPKPLVSARPPTAPVGLSPSGGGLGPGRLGGTARRIARSSSGRTARGRGFMDINELALRVHGAV